MPTVPRLVAQPQPQVDDVFLHMAAHIQHQWAIQAPELPRPKGGFYKEDIEKFRTESEKDDLLGGPPLRPRDEYFETDQGKPGRRI